MTRSALACCALACLVLAACTTRAPVETELRVIRGYGWPATVIDPEPDWSPDSATLVVRSLGGFSLLEEGGRGVRQYAAEDRRDTYHPRWIGPDRFVFGPGHNAVRTAEGRVVPPSDGITQVVLGGVKPMRTHLADRGYRPRPGADGRIWAQDEDRILVIDPKEGVSTFGDGFDPEPQPDGPGLCWRDLPASGEDWWTGRNGPGTMFVRWKPGRVDQVAGAVQAAWTRDHRVLLTVIDAVAPAGKPWWAAGTRLLALAGPGVAPVELRRNVRDPAPHPLAELMAWVDESGGVWMGSIRPDGWSERVAPAGSGPRWSPDGLRLTWTEPAADAGGLPSVRVAVLGPKR